MEASSWMVMKRVSSVLKGMSLVGVAPIRIERKSENICFGFSALPTIVVQDLGRFDKITWVRRISHRFKERLAYS